MKKGLITTLVTGVILSLSLISCGTKYTPMTEDQKQAKADSIFTAGRDAKLQEAEAACASSADAEAQKKFEEMKTASAAEAATN